MYSTYLEVVALENTLAAAVLHFPSSTSDTRALATVTVVWAWMETTRPSGGTHMATPVLGVDMKNSEQASEYRQ